MVSEQDSSHSEPAMAWAVPRLDQITLLLGVRTLFSGAPETVGQHSIATERIRTQEYSNSCPHFKQTWYVRFLIVNTPLLWR